MGYHHARPRRGARKCLARCLRRSRKHDLKTPLYDLCSAGDSLETGKGLTESSLALLNHRNVGPSAPSTRSRIVSTNILKQELCLALRSPQIPDCQSPHHSLEGSSFSNICFLLITTNPFTTHESPYREENSSSHLKFNRKYSKKTSIAVMSLSNKLSITDVDLKGKRVLIRVSCSSYLPSIWHGEPETTSTIPPNH